MDITEILARCDHTLLKQTSTWEQIRKLCDEGIRYHTASVCIPPCYVRQARDYAGDRLKICTVIGFPNGYATSAVKVYETEDAVRNGADEIDMVINIGMVKEQRYADVLDEIRAVRRACKDQILKVIIETCLLTEEEIVQMCEVVAVSGADFIKTSTGFAGEGATFRGVELIKETMGDRTRIKAAGGIRTLEDAQRFVEIGADRLGTSRIVALAAEKNSAETNVVPDRTAAETGGAPRKEIPE